MKSMTFKLSLAFTLLGMAKQLNAQTPFVEKYTFTQLNDFWKSTGGSPSADKAAAMYEAALLTTNLKDVEKTPETMEAEKPKGVLGQISALLGAKPSPTSPESIPEPSYTFFTYRLTAATSAFLTDRQIKLNNFLSRSAFYDASGILADAPVGDTAVLTRVNKEKAELAKLRRAASLELYYIQIARTAQATKLPVKCRSIQDADSLRAPLLTDVKSASLTDEDFKVYFADSAKPLVSLFSKIDKRYGQTVATKAACLARPLLSKSEQESKIIAKVEGKVVNYLQDEQSPPKQTLAAINAIVQKYKTVLESIQVDPKTKELLELERNLANVQSNVEMVASDMLLVKADVEKMSTLDLSTIDSISSGTTRPQHPLISKVNKLRGELITQVAKFLKAFESVHTKAAANEKSQLSSCNELSKNYLALVEPLLLQGEELKIREVKPIIFSSFNTKYSSCLTQISDYATSLTVRTETDEYLEEFAKQLEQLSDKVLTFKSQN